MEVTEGEFDQGIGIEFDGTGDSCTLCEVHGGYIRNCLNGYKLTMTAAFQFFGGYVAGIDLANSIGVNNISGETTRFYSFTSDACAKGIVLATGGGQESDRCVGYGVRLENNNVGIEVNTDDNKFFGTTINGASGDVGFNVNAGALDNKLIESAFVGLDTADRVQDAGTRTTRIDRFQHYVQDEAVHTIGHKIVAGASAGDFILANGKKLKSVDAAGTGTNTLIMQDATDITNLFLNRARSADGAALGYLYAEDEAGTAAIVFKVKASGTGVGNQTVRFDFTDHETDTSANVGENGDVPAQVVGYLTVEIAGTKRKIPYYAD